MSDEKIDHAALANQAVSIAGMREAIQQGESVSDIAAVAQVHATLALVEQQRIANLIALLNGGVNSEAVVNAPGDFSTNGWYGLYDEVRKGLGL